MNNEQITNATGSSFGLQKMPGKEVCIRLVIRNAHKTPGLREACEVAGIKLAVGLSNTREVFCKTPAELDSARDPIKSFFV